MRFEEFKALKPEMVELLRTASYHYADDTGKEWGAAGRAMDEFTDKVFEYHLTFWHIEEIILEADPLMPRGAIFDGVIRKGYALYEKCGG